MTDAACAGRGTAFAHGWVDADDLELTGDPQTLVIATAEPPVIVDVLERHEPFARWLAANGFQKERPYSRMALGRVTLFGDPGRTLAIAGPELG